MPKASMKEDHLLESGKDKVRFARQFGDMEPVSESQGVDKLSKKEFRQSAFAPNPAHVLGAFLARQRVNQR